MHWDHFASGWRNDALKMQVTGTVCQSEPLIKFFKGPQLTVVGGWPNWLRRVIPVRDSTRLPVRVGCPSNSFFFFGIIVS